MARIYEPDAEMEAAYAAWVAKRPPHVRGVAERFAPWELYRLKGTNQRVLVLAFNDGDEGVTLRVSVSGTYNLTVFDREVFGINPDDLEPCDLPPADEPVGTILSATDVEENLDSLRLLARPDIWEAAPDGTAKKRRRH